MILFTAFGLVLTLFAARWLRRLVLAWPKNDPGLCAACGYELSGLLANDDARCPECGAEGDRLRNGLAPQLRRQLARAYTRASIAVVLVLLFGMITVSSLAPFGVVQRLPDMTLARMNGTWLDPLGVTWNELDRRRLRPEARDLLTFRGIRLLESRPECARRCAWATKAISVAQPQAGVLLADGTAYTSIRYTRAVVAQLAHRDVVIAPRAPSGDGGSPSQWVRASMLAAGQSRPRRVWYSRSSRDSWAPRWRRREVPIGLRPALILAEGPPQLSPPFDLDTMIAGGPAWSASVRAWLHSDDLAVAAFGFEVLPSIDFPDESIESLLMDVGRRHPPLGDAVVDAFARRVHFPGIATGASEVMRWADEIGSVSPLLQHAVTDAAVRSIMAVEPQPAELDALLRWARSPDTPAARAMEFAEDLWLWYYRVRDMWVAERVRGERVGSAPQFRDWLVDQAIDLARSADERDHMLAVHMLRCRLTLGRDEGRIVSSLRRGEIASSVRRVWRQILLDNTSSADVEQLLSPTGPWFHDPVTEPFADRFGVLDDATARAWAPHLRSRLELANDEERERILRCLRHPALGDPPAND
ncbi:MAG: hypothetical protein AAF138_02955 [Planctomycetota bacterium]